jgi:Fur family transcriptional regulator, zinc uptake regulator
MTQCSDPNHSHDTTALLAEVRAKCVEMGLRFTPLREKVLELITRAHGPVKAYTLLEQLKNEHEAAAPPTVYRALEFLLDNGFVHKVESINAFVACPHPSGAHLAQFLVCDHCGTAIELEGQSLPTLLIELATAQQFSADKLVVEVHGRCRNCSEIPILLTAPLAARKSITNRARNQRG